MWFIRFTFRIIRFLLLPLKGVIIFFYPELGLRGYAVQYTWYQTKAEYDQIMRSNKIDSDEVLKTYEEWKAGADETLQQFSDSGIFFLKIIVKPKSLRKWLYRYGLENTRENRQNYVLAIYAEISAHGLHAEI